MRPKLSPPTTNSPPQAEALAAEVAKVPWLKALITAHRLAATGRIYDTCVCRWYGPDHSAHVAAEVTNALVAALAQARASAWQEAHEASCEMAGNCWGGGCPLHENPYTEALGAGEAGCDACTLGEYHLHPPATDERTPQEDHQWLTNPPPPHPQAQHAN